MRKIIIGIIFFFPVSNAFSQFNSFSLKAGLTLADYYEEILAESTFKPGMSFGISSTCQLSQKVDLKPELMFEQKGTKITGLPDDHTQIYTFNYINVPILVKYNLGKKNNGFINSGITAGYLITATNQFKGTVNGEYRDEKASDDLSVFNRVDFGLGIGGGIKVPINEKNGILIDLRYSLSLTSTNKKDKAVIYPKQHTIGIYLGYIFRVKKEASL